MAHLDVKHPADLIEGHIDALVRRGIAKGIPIWNMLQAACINPVNHYSLPSGLMKIGDKATFIAVSFHQNGVYGTPCNPGTEDNGQRLG